MPAQKIYWLSVIADGNVGQPLISEDVPARPLEAHILDENNDLVADATNVGTVTISTGPPGAVLSGTTVLAATNGVLIFPDLTLDRAGTFNLRIDSPGLEGSTNALFQIAAVPANEPLCFDLVTEDPEFSLYNDAAVFQVRDDAPTFDLHGRDC